MTKFKYRLSAKSGYKAILEAVEALGMDFVKVKTERYVKLSWTETVHEGRLERKVWRQKNLTLEDLPEWLNTTLEERGLLNPTEKI